MTWPNDVVTRAVTGTYLTALGAPAKGRVVFTPTSRILDENDAVIIEDAITATLDSDGYFSVSLPTTDNKLLSPAGWAYEVNVRLYGVKPRKFYVVLPYADGSPVDLVSGFGTADTTTTSTSFGAVRGPIGPRGAGTLVGEGFPASTLGQDGDIYIDASTGAYYGPKSGGVWPSISFYAPDLLPALRYVYAQATAASTWVVTHALGGRPSVTVVDTSGTVVIGEVSYNSNTTVTISFTAPFSGYAYLT